MAERITLDPSEVATDRTELDITSWINQEGIDWGDAEISAFMSEQQRGETPIDYRVPNRTVEIPLTFQARGTTTANTARAELQHKLSLFQREGGWLKRITAFGGTVYADVVNATFHATSVSGLESREQIDIDAHATLECIPDFYGDEVTLSDHTETSSAELIFTETAIDGDFPGRMRLVVDDDQGQDQRGVVWGFRSRHYSAASTAALKYEAEALQPLDTAVKAALSGASGGTVVTHGTLSTSWTPVVGTNIGGSTYLTHTGTYRLYGRVYSTSGTTVQARAVWDVGDLVNPAENDSWRLPGASNFYVHDFGELRFDPSPVGTHRWQGQIQAKGDAGGENFSVDKLWLISVDEGMGVLTAPIETSPSGFTPSYSVRSEFNTESGAITGDSLAVGGVWTTGGTAVDSDDFSAAGGIGTRTATSDSGTGPADLGIGRIVTAGTAVYSNVFAQVDIQSSDWTVSTQRFGMVLRYTDVSNYVALHVQNATGGLQVKFVRQLAGAQATLWVTPVISVANNAWYTLKCFLRESGDWFFWFSPQGSVSVLASGSGSHSSLGTGGALASGKLGLADEKVGATAVTRSFDNFAAWVPTPDAVIYASRSAQLTTEGHYRLDSGGTAYGPVSHRVGDLPRFPVAGLEGRTTEVFVKASRGDFDQLPDSGIDDISARVYHRPSWLFIGDEGTVVDEDSIIL